MIQPFRFTLVLRIAPSRVCRAHFRAAYVHTRTYTHALIRIADTCFVFIVRQNSVSGQTMGRVEQRRYLLERAESGHGEARRISLSSFKAVAFNTQMLDSIFVFL